MATLEVPADVVAYLLRYAWGQSIASLDGASFQATRDAQVAAGLVWAVRWTGGGFREFARQAGLYGHADLFREGPTWHYVYRDRRAPVLQFDPATNQIGEAVFARTPPRTGLTKTLSVAWDPDYTHGGFRRAIVLTSTLAARLQDQRGRNVLGAPQTLELAFVNQETTALRVGHAWAPEWDRQHWQVTVQAGWDAVVVQRGTFFTVVAPLLGPSGGTSVWFRCRSKRYRPDTDTLEVVGVEAGAATYSLRGRVRLRLSAGTRALRGRVALATVRTRRGRLQLVATHAPSLRGRLGLHTLGSTSLRGRLAPSGWADPMLLLETGDHLLLETGDKVLAE